MRLTHSFQAGRAEERKEGRQTGSKEGMKDLIAVCRLHLRGLASEFGYRGVCPSARRVGGDGTCVTNHGVLDAHRVGELSHAAKAMIS